MKTTTFQPLKKNLQDCTLGELQEQRRVWVEDFQPLALQLLEITFHPSVERVRAKYSIREFYRRTTGTLDIQASNCGGLYIGQDKYSIVLSLSVFFHGEKVAYMVARGTYPAGKSEFTWALETWETPGSEADWVGEVFARPSLKGDWLAEATALVNTMREKFTQDSALKEARKRERILELLLPAN